MRSARRHALLYPVRSLVAKIRAEPLLLRSPDDELLATVITLPDFAFRRVFSHHLCVLLRPEFAIKIILPGSRALSRTAPLRPVSWRKLLPANGARCNALCGFRLSLIPAPEIFGMPSAFIGAAFLEGPYLNELLPAMTAHRRHLRLLKLLHRVEDVVGRRRTALPAAESSLRITGLKLLAAPFANLYHFTPRFCCRMPPCRFAAIASALPGLRSWGIPGMRIAGSRPP